MRIIELLVENVKRLRAVQIRPDGSLVVIGGKNGAGKTSVLDSIAYALGGKDLVCGQPLRKGEEDGFSRVDLGEFVVTRTFTENGGGSLKVENQKGARFPSPQAMLDKMVGQLSFDPLEFSRMEPRRQMETLKALVGLDFAAIDTERAELYSERTGVNRTTKQLEDRLARMTQHADAPSEEVLVRVVLDELEAADAEARRLEGLCKERGSARLEAETARQCAAEVDAEIDGLRQQAVRLKSERDDWLASIPAHEQEATEIRQQIENVEKSLPNRETIRARIDSAEETNRQVKENRAYAEQSTEAEGSREQGSTLTGQIEALDAQKAEQIEAARFPVDGLSFGDGEVIFGGIPFDQASSAEQLRVSIAMGLAMNPKLKVLLIRDGSLLDEESMELVADMAAKADAQVWLERVGQDESTSVVIEDGAVKGAEAEAAA